MKQEKKDLQWDNRKKRTEDQVVSSFFFLYFEKLRDVFSSSSYCPGGPDSDFEYSTQSYTGYEVSLTQSNANMRLELLLHEKAFPESVRRSAVLVCETLGFTTPITFPFIIILFCFISRAMSTVHKLWWTRIVRTCTLCADVEFVTAVDIWVCCGCPLTANIYACHPCSIQSVSTDKTSCWPGQSSIYCLLFGVSLKYPRGRFTAIVCEEIFAGEAFRNFFWGWTQEY